LYFGPKVVENKILTLGKGSLYLGQNPNLSCKLGLGGVMQARVRWRHMPSMVPCRTYNIVRVRDE